MSPQAATKLRIAVGVSGGGRSLANLVEWGSKQSYEVALVFSSSPSIGANDVAKKANLPLLIEDFSAKNRDTARKNLYNSLVDKKIDLVVLAGFLKLLPMDPSWPGEIINIHPALLPKFGGKGMHGCHVHEAVLAARESESGASVHFVNARYDEGKVIAQSRVPVTAGETAGSLADKVFASECDLLPWVIGELARGGLPKEEPVIFNRQESRL